MLGGSRSLAAVLAIVLVASPALADRKPPSEKDKQLAGDLVKRAIAKSKAGDHDAAIAIYQQAYATVASSALLSNIGAEYQLVGKPKEALRYFCMYLEKDPVGANAPYAVTQAKLLQSQLTNHSVDDAELCAIPEAREPKPVSDEPVAPRVEPRRPPAPPPTPVPEVVPAHHTRTLMYTGAGIGAAGLLATGLGLYYGVKAQNISDEITNHPVGDKWVTIRDLQSRGQSQENRQIGFLIAGGVLVTTGVILVALGRANDAPEPTDKPIVRVVPTTNGVAVLGRF